MLGYDGERPMHVLIAENAEANETIVINAYEPSPDIWMPGWMQKKRS